MPVCLVPLRPLFSRWYNDNVQCDYHVGNPGHSTKNCSALKYEVQDLIKFGKLKFEESNGSIGVEDLSTAKAEMIRQEGKALREANSGKVAILTDEVPITKVERNEAKCSSTTEGLKERLGKSNGEEEKKTL